MVRGYDNPRFNHQLVMDLQFHEGVGALTLDWSKSHMAPNTLTGAPTWTFLGNDLAYLDFDPTIPDYIITLAADSGVTNFTSGDFSGAAWVNPADLATSQVIFNRGITTTTSGWAFYINPLRVASFLTVQAGSTLQHTISDAFTPNVWSFIGFTRTGAVARIYINGRDDTNYSEAHIDPDNANAQNFYIGCGDAVVADSYLDGGLWRPRIWDRCLTAAEMLAQYEIERGLFGV